MEFSILDKNILQTQRSGCVTLTTRDKNGEPFTEKFEKIDLLTDMHIALRGWFFPKTLDNLRNRKALSLVVWDTGAKRGFELQGKLVLIDDLAYADGRLNIDASRIPQSKKQMLVAIEQANELDEKQCLQLTEEANCFG